MSKQGVILGLVLAAVAIPSVIPSTAQVAQASAFRHEVYKYYYSGSNQGPLVGIELVVSCDDGVVNQMMWGTKTIYYKIVDGASCYGPIQ